LRDVVLFGSSGIRGVFGKEITPELMLDIGKAVGSRYKRIVLGRDVRTTGHALSCAFAGGALSSGASVEDGGVVSTPTIAFAAKDYECGAVVTASHNPPEYNGIKLWNPSGIAFDEQQQMEIEEALERRTFEICRWDKVSTTTIRSDLAMRHAESVIKAIGPVHLKVVVDCACGSTSEITPHVLRRLGCNVIALNSHPDGHFPGRPPEPSEDNLGLLRRIVPETGADLGLAHDGDGDRVVAVDEKGGYVGGEKLLPLFVSHLAGKSAVVPVDASMAIDDLLKDGKVWRTRVGDVYVAQEVMRRKAEFGGEPSGTFIFPAWGLFPDGIYAGAYLASLVQKRRLSVMTAGLPSYPSLRGAFTFEAVKRLDVEKALEGEMSAVQDAQIERTDGWRLQFDDGWGLIRISGTEPKVRVLAEARTEMRTKEIYESLVSKVKAGVG